MRAWRKRIVSGAPYGAAARAEAARLHALVLSPLASRLDPLRRLVIAGDGVLHLVPFEALEDESGRLLLERHVVSYAPSASVAGALHERRSARPTTAARLLAYAEPPSEALGPLPLARREAQAIAALFPAGAVDVRQGARASESWLKHADARPLRRPALRDPRDVRRPRPGPLGAGPRAGAGRGRAPAGPGDRVPAAASAGSCRSRRATPGWGRS